MYSWAPPTAAPSHPSRRRMFTERCSRDRPSSIGASVEDSVAWDRDSDARGAVLRARRARAGRDRLRHVRNPAAALVPVLRRRDRSVRITRQSLYGRDPSSPEGECVRIVLPVLRYVPALGGATRLVQLIAEGSAARGHSVTVVTQAEPGLPDEEMVAGVRVLRLGMRHVAGFRVPKGYLRLLRSLDADVLH